MQTCILYANYTFFKSFFEGKCEKYHRIQTKVKILNKKKTILNFMNQESIQGIMSTHIK